MSRSPLDTPSPPQDLQHLCWSDFEVAELMWVNGQPRVVCSNSTWEKPAYDSGDAGTLQSLVDQATGTLLDCSPYDLSPAVGPYDVATREEPVSVDGAGKRCRKRRKGEGGDGAAAASNSQGGGARLANPTPPDGDPTAVDKACGLQNQQEKEGNKELGNGKKASISTKRSRIPSVHNQSEKRRRERFNHRMKALQKLLPKSSKLQNDTVSILDDVISYMQKLQIQMQMQMQMMSSLPQMIMPMMPMQQLQMAMMAQMNMMTQMGLAAGTNPIPPPLFRSVDGSSVTNMASPFTMKDHAQPQVSRNVSRTESSAPPLTDADSTRLIIKRRL